MSIKVWQSKITRHVIHLGDNDLPRRAVTENLFTKAYHTNQDPPGFLLEWTNQDSYPVAVYEDERPRTGWAEILLLAERLRPEPALIPSAEEERALLFGLGHEMLGEMGLAWCRRLLGLTPHLESLPNDPEVARYRYKYAST